MTFKSPQFRIALNSRCARACFFCRPSGEGLMTAAHTELPLDCIRAVASEVRAMGVRHVKLTGGDPAAAALRRPVPAQGRGVVAPRRLTLVSPGGSR